MEHIGAALAQTRRNIEIIGADPATRHGFTMVPNFLLTNKKLTVGAKLAYAMLLKYAWSDDACYPGQQKLAGDMGSAERSVRTYLKELEDEGCQSAPNFDPGSACNIDPFLSVLLRR